PYKSHHTHVEIDNLTKSTQTKSVNPKTRKPNKLAFFQMIPHTPIHRFKIPLLLPLIFLPFISLIQPINIIFPTLPFNFKHLIPYFFPPIPFLIPIPSTQPLPPPSLIPTKLITNHFLPILHFKNLFPHLSPTTQPIISLYLLSFPNFATLRIILPSIKPITHNQPQKLPSFPITLLLRSTLPSIISPSIIPLLF
ncbi:nucleoside transporter C-terminal domain-containing protein, partial [Staphylococcus aureus]|uniref:nucleoside transporter C-terminal domain-containing protein n=1 Tax=Staphylococcus aureus TaxID=1280 RepID=UPI0011A2A2C3